MPRQLAQRASLISQYVSGATRHIVGPSALMVETTVRCNLLCPMCPRTGAGYPNQDLPDELLWPLLESHARLGGDHVYLYGLGEPLMDVRLPQILRRCRELGVHTVVSTNATLLTAARRTALLEDPPDHVLVGIDGATEATYQRYRVGGHFDRVVANVEAYALEKARRAAPTTLVVQFIRMAGNEHEEAAFVARWRGVAGVDEVRIKDEDIGLPEHRTFEIDGERRAAPCHFLWRGPILVRYTGDVFPCYHFGGLGRSIGNLRDAPLEELWNAAPMVALRELHVSRRAGDDSACRTCPAPRPTVASVAAAMSLRGATVRRLVPVAERVARALPGLLTEQRSPR